jgi:hypothetical protein
MKIKTNVRAGQGGSIIDTSTSTSTQNQTGQGGVNSGGGGGGFGGKPTVYVPIGRCVGI